jgi:hypothetical protein
VIGASTLAQSAEAGLAPHVLVTTEPAVGTRIVAAHATILIE